jgi:hypothetical protein
MDKDYRSFDVVSGEDRVVRFYRVSARNEGQLNMLEKFFVYVEYLCSVGASREVSVFVDGDGALGLSFASHGVDEFVFRDLDFDVVMDKDSGYGSVSVGRDDEGSFFDLG